MTTDPALQARVEAKLRRQRESIPSAWRLPPHLASPAAGSDVTGIMEKSGIMTQQELEILDLDALMLHQDIALRRYKIREVTEAYCKAAAIAHQLTNCLTEIMFDSALQRAESLDANHEKGAKLGKLYGVPVSLKDSLGIKGVDYSTGYVARIDKPAAANALLTDILLDAGAVLHCKTNIPQTMMTAESINNVFGTTVNPYNTGLTCGGSTGGEGALIALKGSSLGFGTDIAGSVRMPALCCGIYALKPSVGRIPTLGCATTVPGQESVPPCLGPMASSVNGLDLLMDTIAAAKPWETDVRVIPMPWNQDLMEEVSERPLRIGVISHDGRVRPHPPIERALKKTVEKLKKAGHEVIEWPAFDYAPVQDLSVKAFCADGCVLYRDVLNEGKEPPVGPILLGVDSITGKHNSEISVGELWALHAQRNAFTIAHNKQWLATASLTKDKLPIDCILGPAAAHVAVPHGQYDYLGYTNVWNVLDYSASSFPVPGHRVKKDPGFDRQAHLSSYQPLNDLDRKNWERWDPNAMVNAPVNLQLVTRRLEDEKNIGILYEIMEVLS